MAYKYRPMLRSAPNNAGLAQLAGGVGFGIEKAGRQIANLGNTWDKQDARDKAISDAERLRLANVEAATKTKQENQNAMRAKNYALNPNAVSLINKQAGIVGDLASDPNAPTLANANLGIIDLGTAKKQDSNKVKFIKPASDGGNDIIYFEDGTTQRSKFKQKSDWNSGSKSSSASKAPSGYKFAGEFDINDTLDYELATSGAYYTDPKTGMRYVNKAKYDRLVELGNTEL